MTKQNLSFLDLINSFFKGIGQIMLQNNPWTGLLFMVGICFGSYLMGIAAIFAVITGTTTAMLLKYPNNEISDGLYGFSAALVGVALICFFQPTVAIWVAILIGSVLATVIQRLFIAKKIPAFTFPFILVTWLFLCLFHYFPSLVKPQLATNDAYINNYLTLFAHGFGQVIFQVNIWAGILFMIGIFISRPIAAIYAIVGIALSIMIAYQLKEPVNDIYLGLLSYNAVLCAITFAGKKREDLIRGLIAVILSVLIMIQMRDLNLPALTFPFVLATWLVLITKIIPLKASNK
jgi:urea transporter